MGDPLADCRERWCREELRTLETCSQPQSGQRTLFCAQAGLSPALPSRYRSMKTEMKLESRETHGQSLSSLAKIFKLTSFLGLVPSQRLLRFHWPSLHPLKTMTGFVASAPSFAYNHHLPPLRSPLTCSAHTWIPLLSFHGG